ncbi:tRNA processing endoribonuclease [Apiospora hydei]|uniref:ribonuclease Z n=1 Tax=Apiospora hydei TaxID=1337664 RepID=A0ABR1WZM4_9PEZI
MSAQRSFLPPRHRFQSNQKSTFEGAEIPNGLFEAKKGATLKIIPVPATLRLGKKQPFFFLVDVPERDLEAEKKDEADKRARAFGAKMLNWIQIVTTPTADTPGTSLVLHFDDRRYVFGNISEGTQRAMVQRKIALNKTEDVFITGPVDWHSAGGLLGMVLTLADVIASAREHLGAQNAERQRKGKSAATDKLLSRLSIHGGKNLSQFLATARRFIFRKGLPLKPHEIRNDPRVLNQGSNEPDWQDTNIKVWYVLLEPADKAPVDATRKRNADDSEAPDTVKGDSTEEEDFQATQNVVTQMFNSNWRMDALVETTLHEAKLPAKLFVRDEHGHIQVRNGTGAPHTEPARQSICYIVKNHDRRGKFDPKKAAQFDIQKKDYSSLTRGESVTAKDGSVVTPEMVLGDTVLGKGFAVVDIPDVSYIEPLLNRSEWSNAEIMDNVCVMFWLLGPDVATDARLQSFMKDQAKIRHIVCSGDTAPNMIALESVATQAYKLHSIDPERFPLPYFSNVQTLHGHAINESPDGYEAGRTGKMIQFSPQFLHQDDKIVGFPDLEKLAGSEPQFPEVTALANKARERLQDTDFLAKIEKVESDIPNRDAEVITLGTGSALPSKYRNVSATLVKVPGYGNYLFDAGENTMGQLRRVFGKELPTVLRELKAVWISHLHADHHLGTAGVIGAWNKETSKSNSSATLHVASHMHMLDWLREYAQVEEFGYNRLTFTEFRNYDAVTRIANPRIFGAEQTEAHGIERIDACFVDHCHGALATVFTWPSGLKIAYSGDCRPSDSFVKIGQGVTLLIHESTFDDELKGDAVAKKHSTMSEAIDVGRRMGARRILLTHFSQRYQKVPVIEENLEVKPDADGKDKARLDEIILVAFDYMRVKLGEFRKAQAFLPAIQKLFDDVTEQ